MSTAADTSLGTPNARWPDTVTASRLPWLGLAIGAAWGVFDTVLFIVLGVEIRWGETNMAPWLALVVAVNMGLLGWFIGKLLVSRRRERAAAATIAAQLAELERTQIQAIHTEKLAAIGRLAAQIAHEVRNPLGVIKASASLLADGASESSEERRACEFITDEIDRLDQLITALLGFARPTQLNLRQFEPSDVANRAVELAAEALRAAGAETAVDVSGARTALGDPALLAQVLLDLLVNAAEALDETDSPRVAVSVGTDGGSARGVTFDVADSGPGVEPEFEPNLFEPFATTKVSGTGLGLATAAGIVEAHGGRIEYVRGEGLGPEGQGARFRVTLPEAPESSPAGPLTGSGVVPEVAA